MNQKYPKWNYIGDKGPNSWYKLHPSFYIAKTGEEQSPINIHTSKLKKLSYKHTPKYHYFYSQYKLKTNINYAQLEIKNSYNFIILDGVKFYLKYIDLHISSEHLINGLSYPMELQLVHKNEDNHSAIIALLVKEGSENEIFEEALNELANIKEHNQEIHLKHKFNLKKEIPLNSRLFRYRGSFTTPPTNEYVHWIIYEKPIEFSKNQIKIYKNIFHYNARPIQLLNHRNIFVYKPTCYKIIL
jgi:Carbonic anhydrase